MSSVGRQAKQTTGAFNAWFNKTKQVNKSLVNLNKDVNRTASGLGLFNKALSAGRLYMFVRAVEYTIKAATDMVETLNLFNVSLGDMAVSSDQLVASLSSASGLDTTNLRSSIGTYAFVGTVNGNEYQTS